MLDPHRVVFMNILHWIADIISVIKDAAVLMGGVIHLNDGVIHRPDGGWWRMRWLEMQQTRVE